jgi:HEPN domain-containing protein
MPEKSLRRLGPLAGVLRWPTGRSRDWVLALLNSATSDANILAVIAVGSAVRPGVRSSDFDMLVLCTDPSALTAPRPLEVDMRAYSSADVESQLAMGHDLLGWAVMFGRVLFQRDSFWDKLVGSWRHRLPLPSSTLARTRAAAAYRHASDLFQIGDADAAYEQAVHYLTHLARAALLENGVYPASRPELPEQLRKIGNHHLAEQLDRILEEDTTDLAQLGELLGLTAKYPAIAS